MKIQEAPSADAHDYVEHVLRYHKTNETFSYKFSFFFKEN